MSNQILLVDQTSHSIRDEAVISTSSHWMYVPSNNYGRKNGGLVHKLFDNALTVPHYPHHTVQSYI